MKNKERWERSLPDRQVIYTVAFFALSVLASQIAYQGGRAVTRGLPHTDITTALDTLIPFVPWTVTIYFGTFAFWIASFYFISRGERRKADRFFCAQIITYTVTLLIFLFFPTTNIRPDITGSSLWDVLMRFLYSADTPDGLFPSLHCTVSWLCWIGTRNNKKSPAAVRILSLIIALAICLSTLTTKQHVIADAIGGIFLSEAAYAAAGNERLTGIFSRLFDWILLKITLKKDSAR